MHTAGEERAMSAMNHSDLSNRVDYIREIIDYYPESSDAAIAIMNVIAGIELSKDKMIADRETAIQHLSAFEVR